MLRVYALFLLTFCVACSGEEAGNDAGLGSAATGGGAAASGTGGAGGVAATGGTGGAGAVSGTGGIGGTGGVAGTGGFSGVGSSGGADGGLGEYCIRPEDCDAGLTCIANLFTSYYFDEPGTPGCSKACDSDTECGESIGFVCGVGPDGSRMCVPPCDDFGYVCQGGFSVSCEIADDVDCEECGCLDQRCAPGIGCVPLSTVGEPCLGDSECNTGNCSYFAGVCRVPVGQPCDGTNCDDCLSEGSWSFCTRPCRAETQCNGELCVGSSSFDRYSCVPPCSSDCPGQCRTLSGSPETYCWCPDCEHTSPLRAVGNMCSYDSQCASNECLTGRNECSPSYSSPTCNAESGWCTETCSADSCPNGTQCVDIPCAEGEGDTCGPKCLPTCTDPGPGIECATGYCQALPTVGGGESIVCGQKAPDDSACSVDRHCRSGLCSAQVCVPQGGA